LKTIGHYGHRVLAGILLLTAAMNLAGVDLGWAATVVLLPAMAAAIVGQRIHDGRLCERCVTTMPLNGAERAERRRRILRTVHTTSEPIRLAGRPIVPPLALYMLGGLAAVAVIVEAAGLERGGHAALALVAALFYVPLAGLMLAISLHARLQPWCPYCRWGGGGDGPHEVAPDPDPHGRRPRPVCT
jgi:hypothetical protein